MRSSRPEFSTAIGVTPFRSATELRYAEVEKKKADKTPTKKAELFENTNVSKYAQTSTAKDWQTPTSHT